MAIQYPAIDPVAFSVGPLSVHWYGITYLVGFSAAWLLANYRARQPGSGWNSEQVSDLIFYGAVGIILGGRLGYGLFYANDQLFSDPLWLIKLQQGGMSFHGGFLGSLAAMTYFTWKSKKSWLAIGDFISPMVPIGLGAGRIGNFINGELWGRATEMSWGMVFPGDTLQLVRHPSQLYQSLLEGLMLFAVLWWFSSRARPRGAVGGLFVAGYGVARIIGEFFREPDAHIGFVGGNWLTMGMLLSVPMVLFGIGLMIWAYKTQGANPRSV